MLIPTPRFYFFLALGMVVAALGALSPGLEYILIPYDLGLFIVFLASGLVARRWDGLAVTRETDPVLSVRTTNKVKLTIESDSPVAMRVKVRDEAPLGCDVAENEFEVNLLPDRAAEVSYTITPFDRGEHQFRGTFVRYMAPLGLAWVQKELPTKARARVFPNVKAVKEFDLLMQRGHLSLIGIRKSRLRGLGQEFESLRDYNDDDFRIIDWKASGRRGKLVVRNYETEKNQGVIVCIDLGRHMLAEVAAERQGDQIGLLLFNDTVKKYVPPKRGRAHVAAIVDALFDAQAEPVQSNYGAAFGYLSAHWSRRSLMMVFSDAENEDQAADLSSALASVRRKHKLIVVRVADPRLRDLKNLAMEMPRDLHARAAALWYLGDRRKAEYVMSAAHIQSLESEPAELAASLVGAYLKVKALAQI